MGEEKTSQKPAAAFILSLIGGMLNLLVSVVILGFGTYLDSSIVKALLIGMGAAGLLVALVVIAGAFLLYLRPAHHAYWGFLVVIFSFISLATSLGGLLLALVFGVIGGVLGIAWKPTIIFQTASPSGVMQASASGGLSKTCPNCGGMVPYEARFCPNCGRAF